MTELFRKLLDLLTSRDRWQGMVLLVCMAMVAGVETAGIASIMPFMAVVTNPDVIETNRWLNAVYTGLGMSNEAAFLRFLGILVVVLLVLSNCLKALNTWLTLRFQNKMYYVLAHRLLARYMIEPYDFFLKRNTAELGKNVLAEARNVVTGVITPLTDLVSRSLITLAILGLLVVVDPLVALAIATVLGGSYAVVYIIARLKLRGIGQQQVDANATKFKAASESLSGIKELKVLGRETTFLDRFAVAAKRHSRNNVAFGLISEMPRHALEIISFGGILLVVLYLLGRGDETAGLVPLLALYAFAGYRLLPALQQLFAAFANLRQSMPALELLHRDLEPDPTNPFSAHEQLKTRARIPTLPFRKNLRLDDVTFQYSGASHAALRGLSLEIAANTSVGFVGPTGCGKTTTVDLILGLLSPTSGRLLSDGETITPENLAGWQRNLGYVPQQIYISDDSITRNIAFGIPDSEIDMDAVRRAARVANLSDFVEQELPEGYETEIGERGVRLSGGQRQRIGIARALYRDPPILVMDEATSALDGITEDHVMEAVRALSRSKTIIMIAHRLTTVRDCDVIYLLDHGRVTASGRFDDLYRDSAWFRSAAGGR